jgi:hypothetical protein
MDRIRVSIPVIRYIFDQLVTRIDREEFDKVRTMASAVHNYPGFLKLEYHCTPIQFWEDHIQFTQRFMEKIFLKNGNIYLKNIINIF